MILVYNARVRFPSLAFKCGNRTRKCPAHINNQNAYFHVMSNYDKIKECLEKNGEVMIKLDAGDTIELHKHNVTFDDSSQEIVVDAGVKTIWIDGNKIAYYWIHKQGFET